MPPTKLAHLVYQTNRMAEMRDWYCAVLGAHVVYENKQLCFATYDDEHHRVAFLDFGPLAQRDPAATELGVKPVEQPGLRQNATGGAAGARKEEAIRVAGRGHRAARTDLRKECAMGRRITAGVTFLAWLVLGLVGGAPEGLAQETRPMRVVSDETATGFAFPESVAYDPMGKVLYVSQFGSELKPAEKDGKGKISRVSLTGRVLEDRFLPASPDVLNKPKGLWVAGNRLWVTDIDAVWVFDLENRRGRKVELPMAKFANDLTVVGKALYVSDNRGDQVFRIEPADFLDPKVDPRIGVLAPGKSINPNGLYPARDGSLLMVGFMSADQPRGIYARTPGGDIQTLAKDLGRLDGVYQMADGSLLVTEWNSGSLASWSAKSGLKPLAKDFKGPADFAVVVEAGGLLVVVPDLVKSELRLIRLAK